MPVPPEHPLTFEQASVALYVNMLRNVHIVEELIQLTVGSLCLKPCTVLKAAGIAQRHSAKPYRTQTLRQKQDKTVVCLDLCFVGRQWLFLNTNAHLNSCLFA